MSNTPLPLDHLAQRIQQQQAELENLRQEYATRQTQLQKLTRRKEELQAQLRQVETEIQTLGSASGPAAAPAAPKATKPAVAKPTMTKPATKATVGFTLAELLVRIVSQAGKPLTVKDLTAEVVRRKYPTTSSNIAALIEKRVSELVKKGSLRRAKDQPGVVPARLPGSASAPAPKPSGTTASSPKAAVATKTTASAPSAGAANEQALPAVVTKILAQSSQPLSARTLAEKVLATGYQTTSKNFTNVIWSGIGKMDNVENVPGKGYRLKKAKSGSKGSK